MVEHRLSAPGVGVSNTSFLTLSPNSSIGRAPAPIMPVVGGSSPSLATISRISSIVRAALF